MPFDAETYAWGPQPGPQSVFVSAELECIFEVVYGGARGGGKTDATLGEFAYHADTYGKHAKGLLVRRSATALIPTIERAKAIYGQLGATWQEQKSRFRFPNGAILYFRYLDRDADADLYQGHDYTRVYVEELTQFVSPGPVDKLKATLRSAAGVPCCFRATCNPGGPGHNWVKARYIDPGAGVVVTGENGLMQLFLQAKLKDNPILDINDPMYRERLKLSGSEQLVKAWLDGDWNIIEGAFFDKWSNGLVVEPFKIPEGWARFRSFDWGYSTPFSCGWWAVATDPYPLLGDTRTIPRGAMVRYREWYGCNGTPNVGLRIEAEGIAAGILEREKGELIRYGVADPSCFAAAGGPSYAERMRKAGVTFREADNKRTATVGAMGGWDQLRARMVGVEGVPMIYTFKTCRDSIRTIPVLQHDDTNHEDLNTKSEDHAADDWRYACMSRPMTLGKPIPSRNPPDLGYGERVNQVSNDWKVA